MKNLFNNISTVVIIASSFNIYADSVLTTRSMVAEAMTTVESARRAHDPQRRRQFLNQTENKLEVASQRAMGITEFPRAKQRLIWTLDNARFVLRMDRAAPNRQIQIVLERGNEALSILDQMVTRKDFFNSEELEEALRLADKSLDAVRMDNETRAKFLIQNSIDILRQFAWDIDVTTAMNKLREAKELIRRDNIDNRREMERIRFLIQDTRILVRNSDAYNADRVVHLGQTLGFKKRQVDIQALEPINPKRGIKTLNLLAINSTIAVESIDVFFDVGPVYRLGRITLNQNSIASVEIPGQGRFIRKIIISGRSVGAQQGVVSISGQ